MCVYVFVCESSLGRELIQVSGVVNSTSLIGCVSMVEAGWISMAAGVFISTS